MDILKSLKDRYATKMFDKSKKLSEENLMTILEAGRLAPTSFGLQPFRFLLLEDHSARQAIKEFSYNRSEERV